MSVLQRITAYKCLAFLALSVMPEPLVVFDLEATYIGDKVPWNNDEVRSVFRVTGHVEGVRDDFCAVQMWATVGNLEVLQDQATFFVDSNGDFKGWLNVPTDFEFGSVYVIAHDMRGSWPYRQSEVQSADISGNGD